MQLSIHAETGRVQLSDVPEGTDVLRVLLNEMTLSSLPAGGRTSLDCGPADLLLLRGPGVVPPPRVVLRAVAVDADRQTLDEAELVLRDDDAAGEGRRRCDDDAEKSDTRIFGGDGRLLTATLRAPGEQHTWRLRPADVVPSGVVGPAHVYLRLTLEPQPSPPPSATPPSLTVTWRSDAGPPPAKRTRCGETTMWGRTTCVAHVSGATGMNDEGDDMRRHDGSDSSVFLCPVDDDHDVVVECHVVCCGEGPVPVLRYAIHAHVTTVGSGMPYAAAPLHPPLEGGAAEQPAPRRMAVIVGVSKYSRRPRGDLEWCDEDATAWYRYLTGRGYECRILGDEFSPYPRWDGPATVANVRRAVQTMVREAHRAIDRVVFVDSSHGNGDGRGASYLCLLPDPNRAGGEDDRLGRYWDRDLAGDLSGGGTSMASTFVFLDACFSGGILEELVQQLHTGFGTSTCTQKGYGYDESMSAHGAWTETFLVEGLERQRAQGDGLDLVALFQQALQTYTQRHTARGDRPCCFLSVAGAKFNTNDTNAPPPQGLLLLRDIL